MEPSLSPEQGRPVPIAVTGRGGAAAQSAGVMERPWAAGRAAWTRRDGRHFSGHPGRFRVPSPLTESHNISVSSHIESRAAREASGVRERREAEGSGDQWLSDARATFVKSPRREPFPERAPVSERDQAARKIGPPSK